MLVKPKIAGKLDKHVRDPEIIIRIAKDLGIIPDPDSVIKITGSKGKGTTSRLIAAYLLNSTLTHVGLLVSPEEFEHADRIRIDGKSLTQYDFVNTYRQLQPHLKNVELSLKENEYLSPSGIYLLMALLWFKEKDVKHFVLECGRGAEFDEIAQIQSCLSVVTSIFYEHPNSLGPSISDIAKNKLAIGRTSEMTFLDKSSTAYNERLCVIDGDMMKSIQSVDDAACDVPAWYFNNDLMARKVANQYLKQFNLIACDKLPNHESASFGKKANGNINLYYESLISMESVDDGFVNQLACEYDEVLLIASLPDEKDIENLDAYFRNKDYAIKYIPLSGTPGLSWKKTFELFPDDILEEINFSDTAALNKLITPYLYSKKKRAVYFIGTHTFIRLVKKCFFII